MQTDGTTVQGRIVAAGRTMAGAASGGYFKQGD